MKQRQVRFATEQQIIDAIDDAQSRAEEALAECSKLEAMIRDRSMELDTCYGVMRDNLRSSFEIDRADKSARVIELEIKRARAKIEKLQKTATNLLDKRCKRLGKTLSALRTIPMGAIVGDDQSVVLV